MKSLLVAKIKNLTDVVDWRLCVGCGACAYICPHRGVSLVDFVNEGIRPVVDSTACERLGCTECLQVCPGIETDYRQDSDETRRAAAFAGADYVREWGPVLEMWEGHATDPEIRFKGSSGGVITALATYCIEKGGMSGVLHIGADPDDPIRNKTRLSRSRAEILASAGSRYSPAAVCDGLQSVEDAAAPCVVVGKPTEMAGLAKAQDLRPKLRQNVGVTISFFCAETPSTAGTVSLIRKMGLQPESVTELRYRGYGWPGHFAPICNDETEPRARMTYAESWAYLQAHRPWSAHLWPDGTGELADIACGDPWYEQPDGENPGFSLVVARTPRGAAIIRAAISAGYLQLKRAEHWKLEKSQHHLLRKKGATWGRQLVLRLFGVPTTRFPGLSLWHCWTKLPAGEKVRSMFSTARRVWTRKIYRPLHFVRPANGSPADRIPAGRTP